MARDGLGVVSHAQHATATTRRGIKPSIPLVVSPTLYPYGKTGLKRSGSRDHDDRETDVFPGLREAMIQTDYEHLIIRIS